MGLSFEDFNCTFQTMDIAMENLTITQTVRGTMTFDFTDFKAKIGQDPDIAKMVSSMTKKGKKKEAQMQSPFVNLGMKAFESSFMKGLFV